MADFLQLVQSGKYCVQSAPRFSSPNIPFFQEAGILFTENCLPTPTSGQVRVAKPGLT